MSIALIIPAGGIGNRFASTIKKQYYLIDGKPIIYWSVKRLISSYKFDEIVFGVVEEDVDYIKLAILELNIKCNIIYSNSGKERANTVYNAIKRSNSKYVLVHDAVRPYVSEDTVRKCINEAMKTGGAICGVFSKDSVKLVEKGVIKSSIDRDNIFLAYTPQVFLRDKLIESYEKVFNDGIKVTDDAAAYEYLGYKVSTVISNDENIKVTYLDDTKKFKVD